MDPFTIVQTAGVAMEAAVVCVKACAKIYEFTHDVRTIDKTLSRVEDEVRDLERILKLVSYGLSDNSVQRTGRTTTGQEMLKAVNGSVERSTYVLAKLETILRVIIGESTGGQSTIVALRQAVRSKRKGKELTECIGLVDKSKQNLNVSLSMLGVFMVANSTAYRRVRNEEDIEPLTQQLETALQKSGKSARQTNDNQARLEDAHLRRTAKTVLERAKSPHPEERLSRSSTLIPAVVDEQELEDDGVDLEEPKRYWLDLLDSAKPTRRGSEVGLRNANSDESMDNNYIDSAALVEPPHEIFQIRGVRRFIEKGNDDFARGNKEQALAKLEQAMHDAANLSKQARRFIERDLIQVRLNVAALQTASTEPRLDLAEENLLQAILAINEDTRNSDNELQQSLCKAYLILAKVYCMEGEYLEAEINCLDALNLRIGLGDETSNAYWESHQLLIRIYLGQGNMVKVTHLMDELPDEQRDRMNRTLFSQGQRASMLSPRTIDRGTTHRRNTTPTGISAEPMLPADSQNSHSTGSATVPGPVTSPILDEGGFEDKPDLRRKGSLVATTLREDDVVALLAEAGFRGDFDAQEALNWAIVKNKEHVIYRLLQAPGIKVQKKRAIGAPKDIYKLAHLQGTKHCPAPLFIALSTPGRIMIAKMLLEHGAPTNSRDTHGRSLLEVAAMNGVPETVSILLDHHLTIHSLDGTRAYHLAAQHGHIDVLQLFLRREMKPDERDTEHGYGRTALYWAAWKGHAASVEFLIKHGADPNISDNGGSTPLMAAVRERHTKSIELLLRYFADVNLVNSRGFSALMIACEQGQTPTLRLLLEESSGAKVDIRDNNGWSALIWACSKKNVEMAQVLLEAGANVNAQCNRGSRALDHTKGKGDLVALLKRYNAQPGTGVSRRGTIDDTYRGYVLI